LSFPSFLICQLDNMIGFVGFFFPILVCGLAHTDQPETVELYISSHGGDGNPGTQDEPLRTLEAARDTIRQTKGDGGATVWLYGGRYHLTETFILDERDSGSNERYPGPSYLRSED
jgi:hypothetical protein